MRVKIEGVNELASIYAKLGGVITAAQDEGMNLFLERCKEEAQLIVPVLTGYLRSTIGYGKLWGGWWLGAGAFYGPFVEFGTRYMAPRPFIAPAVLMHLPAYQEYMSRKITERFQELIK